MSPDPSDPLDDVFEAPLVYGPRQPVTIATGVKLAKGMLYAKKLAKAEADYDRWLTRMLRATKRVETARILIRRYRKFIQEN